MIKEHANKPELTLSYNEVQVSGNTQQGGISCLIQHIRVESKFVVSPLREKADLFARE